MNTDSRPAPIALFVYKRPEHTLRTLESLAANARAGESALHVFSDGPKSERDRPLVDEVRRVVRQRRWCGEVHLVERADNRGLARSIMAGVTELVDRIGVAIVVEDDLLLAPHFLDFMNDSLARYRREARIMSVAGYINPARVPLERDACFLPMCSSWGWATWQRAWRHFDPGMSGCERLEQDPFLRYRFDLDGSYPFFCMLQAQKQGRLDSWAIRWYLSVFLRGGLSVFPTRSLVQNVGFDGTGTHCGSSRFFDTVLHQGKLERFPEKIALSVPVYEALKDYFRSGRPPKGFVPELKRLVKWTLGLRKSA